MAFTERQQAWINALGRTLNEEEVGLRFAEQPNGVAFEIVFYTPHGGQETHPFSGEDLVGEAFHSHFVIDEPDWFIDEYVRSYLNAKEEGMTGVPSAAELVEDGRYAAAKYSEIYETLSAFLKEHPYEAFFGPMHEQGR